jgi:hypothetical protein
MGGETVPYTTTTCLTIGNASGTGDLFVQTNAGSGIQLYGVFSNGTTINNLRAVAIGGAFPAYLDISIGSNVALRLSEAGDVKCGYKFACNGNDPVGKSATATTLAQVITCLQDFGFMS